MTCRRPADGAVALTVVPDAPATDTVVRLRVAPVTGYRDPATATRTVRVTGTISWYVSCRCSVTGW